ncbi:hypothetical protein RMSM_00856 [Rhodopirellula maiorica SM1]|uniref:Uncharacterized protein n=1 Tax=Rhodopirellula maiorica SM1 TaxID=1265738 RepID=M5RSE1_9BACT|nr:hypothetical protein RMSM_00856 [Rhodopirellula maiorica SM1]
MGGIFVLSRQRTRCESDNGTASGIKTIDIPSEFRLAVCFPLKKKNKKMLF